MMHPRLSLETLVAVVFALPLMTGAGAARADWPDRPVRWVVPFGPGGANDLIGALAKKANMQADK
jgi:tripartite-type tricarboxylate transporter receptor subunit TctC